MRLLLLIFLFFISCTSRDKSVYVKKIGGEELMICDITRVFPGLQPMPLSELVESVHVVKLENRKEALIAEGSVITTVGKDLIAVRQSQSYRLFSKDGKFLRSIGSEGHGPNEYVRLYADILDEKNGRIYLYSFPDDHLLVYNLEGKPLPSLPLAYVVEKGQFFLKENILTVMSLPFPTTKSVVFQQDMNGKILQEKDASPYYVRDDYSNEIMSSFNTDVMDVYIMGFAPKDTLYHYDPVRNRLIPRLTLDYRKHFPIHLYAELPGHYIVGFITKLDRNEWGAYPAQRKNLLIDKKRRTARFVQLKNDFLGGMEAYFYPPSGNGPCSMERGMYVENLPAIVFKERLRKVIDKEHLSESTRDSLQKLYDSVGEEDNNVIIYGKLKK